MGRYQMVLAPCPATKESSWGKVIGAADSILGLFDKYGWRGEGYVALSWDQMIVVKDTRKGTEMSEEQYHGLVKRLKGW